MVLKMVGPEITTTAATGMKSHFIQGNAQFVPYL